MASRDQAALRYVMRLSGCACLGAKGDGPVVVGGGVGGGAAGRRWAPQWVLGRSLLVVWDAFLA